MISLGHKTFYTHNDIYLDKYTKCENVFNSTTVLKQFYSLISINTNNKKNHINCAINVFYKVVAIRVEELWNYTCQLLI